MKTLMMSIFMVVGVVALGQDITPKIAAAFRSGNSAVIGRHLTPNVDLTLMNKDDVFPADQVERMLIQFFKTHKPLSFEIKHRGRSKLDDQYRIGDLKTTNGMFRVTFFIKKTPKGMRIKQLRIEDFDDDF